MKILFVSSGNHGEISPLIKNQAESLRKEGVEVEHFLIHGKGISGYLKSIPEIRKTHLNGRYHLVHAHYSFSAIASSLAGRFPLVVSLMGSDVYMSSFWRCVAKIFYHFRWDATIVKTQKFKAKLKINRASVIPNGVDLDIFKLIPKNIARERIGYNKNKKLVIFVADPSRYEKNYKLALDSFKLLDGNNVELLPVFNVPYLEIPYYMNAADALLLTSIWEGSVNVVKEAVACNLPVISVDVGDVKSLFGETGACYITTYNPDDIAEKIKYVLGLSDSQKFTNGHERILELSLDDHSVAQKIISIYNSVISSIAEKVEK